MQGHLSMRGVAFVIPNGSDGHTHNDAKCVRAIVHVRMKTQRSVKQLIQYSYGMKQVYNNELHNVI